jgi:hypothetical protein
MGKKKKLLISVFVPEIVFLSIFFATYTISASFPDYIKVQGATDLMKALIDVEGVMLGFIGIIYAQLFSSIMNQQNTIFQRMLTNKTRYTEYESYLKEYSTKKTLLVIVTIATFIFMVASILTSLVSLAMLSNFDPLVDTYAPFSLTFLPMFLLVEAIALLVVALVGLSTTPPKRPETSPPS